MYTKVLMAAGIVVAGCAWIQRWSVERRDRMLVKKVEVPRWEDEGGAPRPDAQIDTPDPRDSRD